MKVELEVKSLVDNEVIVHKKLMLANTDPEMLKKLFEDGCMAYQLILCTETKKAIDQA